MSQLQLYKDEEGQDIAITIKDTTGSNFTINWIVEADTEIIVKTRDLQTTKATITNTDLAFSTPVVTWTPTTAQVGTSIGKGDFKAFVHLRDNANTREVIAEFDLKVLDN